VNIRDLNLRFAFLKAVADAIDAELKAERSAHTSTLLEKWRDEGTKSFNILLPGSGAKVGTITLTEPKPSTDVVDEAAFLAWCKENRPDAIAVEVIPAIPEQVIPAQPERRREYVDPKAQTAILAELKAADDGDVVDPETGTLVDGVEHKPAGEPRSFSVRYEKDGRADLALAYRRGQLDHLAAGTALPQIGGPR
jgi:hypothetical protein